MLQKVNNLLPESLTALDFLSVTQKASIAAMSLYGRCDKNAGDLMAVRAMRESFNSLPHKGIVVVGEGEKDEAPMLYIGEEVGSGSTVDYEIVVDPLEGTRLLAEGKPNAISVIGIVPKGTVNFPKESFYMEKVVLPLCIAKHIDIESPLCDIITTTAKILGKKCSDIVVFILDKPRHESYIKEILSTGARVQLHTDGDVAGSLLAVAPNPRVDIMIGIGGTPEGVLTATAIQASRQGQLFGRFAPQSEKEKTALLHNNIALDTWFTADDIIPTHDVFFIATGVTDGILLNGVHKNGEYYSTHSLVMQGRDSRTFFINEDIPIEHLK